jgi:putative RNA 2'-phosphotransferase
MNGDKLVEASKFLSYILRHKPQAIGLLLDSEGWGSVNALIDGAARQGRALSHKLVEQVVASSDKKRFELSADAQRIRAVQGHSTRSVDREFEPKQPPDILFHGTAARFVDSIRRDGLRPGSRHHVHLSADEQIARSMGQRYGSSVVLRVDAARMYGQGLVFYQAENGVWLTPVVPPGFLAGY